MYINISTDPLWKLIKVRRFTFDRSANRDFIFDILHWRIRINFSYTDWSQWFYDSGE